MKTLKFPRSNTQASKRFEAYEIPQPNIIRRKRDDNTIHLTWTAWDANGNSTLDNQSPTIDTLEKSLSKAFTEYVVSDTRADVSPITGARFMTYIELTPYIERAITTPAPRSIVPAGFYKPLVIEPAEVTVIIPKRAPSKHKRVIDALIDEVQDFYYGDEFYENTSRIRNNLRQVCRAYQGAI